MHIELVKSPLSNIFRAHKNPFLRSNKIEVLVVMYKIVTLFPKIIKLIGTQFTNDELEVPLQGNGLS